MKKFSEYFNEWLYGTDGYYTNYKQIGKEGDFYTSVSTSSFFGGSIAKHIVDTINAGKLKRDTTILEIGAHHGYLFADVVQFIYTLEPELLKTLNFAIVERFEHLRAQQEKYLKDSFGDAIKVTFYNDIKEVNLNSAFVIANEIFDAFPCELVYTKDNELKQGFVKNHKISFEKCEDKDLIQICKKYKITKGEVSLSYEPFIHTLYKNIKIFEFITFDYGDIYPRNDFSTRIYEKHTVFPLFEDNLPLIDLYKNADITYDVNFKHLIDIFKSHENTEVIYKTQMSALVDFGILDLLEILKKEAGETAYLKEIQKVKMLIEPTGMGDRFKMLKISKIN